VFGVFLNPKVVMLPDPSLYLSQEPKASVQIPPSSLALISEYLLREDVQLQEGDKAAFLGIFPLVLPPTPPLDSFC
jgi:hypothetical protein